MKMSEGRDLQNHEVWFCKVARHLRSYGDSVLVLEISARH
jgi:hypothetical protein